MGWARLEIWHWVDLVQVISNFCDMWAAQAKGGLDFRDRTAAALPPS